MSTNALTPAQLDVITAPSDASIVITAVAGAGKTRVLIERALELIGRGTEPHRLLFLSFTRDASNELKRRLEEHKSTQGCTARTIHSLASVILGAKLLDDQKRGMIEKSLRRRINLKPGDVDKALGQDPEALTPLQKTLLRRFDSKRRALNRLDGKNYLTYSEMPEHVIHLWQHDSAALTKAQDDFDYLFVDEYQDINATLHTLITMLVGTKPITVVGDPHQAIFSFQGGDPRFLAEMTERVELDQRFVLEECHRAPAQHVLLAGSFLPQGAGFVPTRGFDGALTIREISDDYCPKDVLVTTLEAIRKRNNAELNDQRTPSSQCAIIVHTNNEISDLFAHLLDHGFDVTRTFSRSKRQEDDFIERYFRTCLRTLAGGRDRQHPLLRYHWQGLDPEDRELLNVGWRTERCPTMLRSYCQSEGARQLLEVWIELIEAGQGPTWQLPSRIAEIFRLGKPNTKAASALCKGKTRLEDVLTTLNYNLPATDSEFLITTIHKAKGREWRDVVVYDGHDWQGGHSKVSPEEARCLAYVALTRSTENLTVIMGNDGHGMFRTDWNQRSPGLQTLAAPHVENLDFSTLVSDYEALPGLRRWIRNSAARHLTRQMYFAVLEALQAAQDPPALPTNWAEPPRSPPRVLRVPLRQRVIEGDSAESHTESSEKRWS